MVPGSPRGHRVNVAVVTSVYGGYDTDLPDIANQDLPVHGVFVTDSTTPRPDDAAWTRVLEPRDHLHPRYAAKVAKCRPDLYVPDADVIVWLDGACRLLRPDALTWVVDGTAGHPLSQFVHPDRQRISDEADASGWMLKYQGQPVHEQVAHYLKDHRDDYGLWATGCIVYRPLLFPVRVTLPVFGDAWLTEQARWTYQDQLSEPVVLADLGLRPHPIPGDLRSNGYMAWAPHNRED